MNFTIKLKQIDNLELSGFIGSVVGGSVTTGTTGYVTGIPSGVSRIDITWSEKPDYIHASIQSSGTPPIGVVSYIDGSDMTITKSSPASPFDYSLATSVVIRDVPREVSVSFDSEAFVTYFINELEMTDVEVGDAVYDGVDEPLLMGNLRGFNPTGCSYFLSDVTRSNNYYLHLSYPV